MCDQIGTIFDCGRGKQVVIPFFLHTCDALAHVANIKNVDYNLENAHM